MVRVIRRGKPSEEKDHQAGKGEEAEDDQTGKGEAARGTRCVSRRARAGVREGYEAESGVGIAGEELEAE